MASFTSSGWAQGATVTVYAQDAFGGQTGSSVDSGTAGADGKVTFSALADSTKYVASDGSRTVRFQTPAPAVSAGSGGAGLPANVTTKTANYTAVAGDFVLADATAGAFTVTLPAGTAGQLVTVKKVDGGGNVVTIAPPASGTVDGDAAGAQITSPQFGAIFECTAANVWKIVAPTSPGGANGLNGAPGAPGADGQTTVTENTQTASYTLVATDAGKSVAMNSASATVLTVPPNSSVAFPVGTIVEVARLGAGTVTIAQGAGVVLRNRLEAAGTTNRTIANQYSAASLRKRASDEWILVGDIA